MYTHTHNTNNDNDVANRCCYISLSNINDINDKHNCISIYIHTHSLVPRLALHVRRTPMMSLGVKAIIVTMSRNAAKEIMLPTPCGAYLLIEPRWLRTCMSFQSSAVGIEDVHGCEV